ncbi:MAG TPA: hypothetical protein VFT14_03530 [Solirubrobacterales bacterium]|nr:hypothetical protein [Solirubrobacterales bacterium]
MRVSAARVAGSAWFAYGSVLLIQAKVLWGIWSYRDLSDGDSSEYFADAIAWADHRWVDPLFSPLHTALWGSLEWLVDDVYAVTIAHRVLIVLGVSLLVLAVARRLLSPGIAWGVAVWWALLPIVYDTRNEIHLFAMVPLLAAVLVSLRFSGPWMRAGVFGVLLGTAVLVRNEAAIAAALWLLVCVAYEIRARRHPAEGRAPLPVRSVAVPFAAVTLIVVGLGSLALLRAPDRQSLGEWADAAAFKRDFALCQHYALGYEERHQGYISEGFTDCERFMQRDFDAGLPSFTEALRTNPGAIGRHFLWNLQLAPYGLQLALFDRTSGPKRKNPDYIEAQTGSGLALVLSIGVLAVVVVGAGLLWRARRRWWEAWIGERAWGWAALGCLAGMGIWVVVTTHPAPAYFFPLAFALICGVGLCTMALVDRRPRLASLRALLPLAALALVLLVPPRYDEGYSTPVLGAGRELAETVSRLESYRDRLGGSDRVLLAPHSYEVCNYLVPESRCTPGPTLRSQPAGTRLPDWLDQEGVDFVYVDEPGSEGEPGRSAVEELERGAWRRTAPADPGAAWVLLERAPGAGPQGG